MAHIMMLIAKSSWCYCPPLPLPHSHHTHHNCLSVSVCLSVCLSPSIHKCVCLFMYSSIYPSICLMNLRHSVYISACLPVYLSIYLSIYLPIYLAVYPPVHLSIYYIPVYLSRHLYIYLCIQPSTHLSFYIFIKPSIFLSICLSVYLSIYLSIYLFICQPPSPSLDFSSTNQRSQSSSLLFWYHWVVTKNTWPTCGHYDLFVLLRCGLCGKPPVNNQLENNTAKHNIFFFDHCDSGDKLTSTQTHTFSKHTIVCLTQIELGRMLYRKRGCSKPRFTAPTVDQTTDRCFSYIYPLRLFSFSWYVLLTYLSVSFYLRSLRFISFSWYFYWPAYLSHCLCVAQTNRFLRLSLLFTTQSFGACRSTLIFVKPAFGSV